MTGIKPSIWVLADDLTGAAEIGGIAFQHGLKARILIDRKANAVVREGVSIMDAGSRNFEPEQACQAVRELISGLDPTGYDLVFMKVDSVLRGPVIAHAAAFMEQSGFDRALMIPANPSKNRIIRDGRYVIDGVPVNETGFRMDPLHPRLTASISGLLNDDGTVVTGNDPSMLLKGKIYIPDVGSVEDVERLVSDIFRPGILQAGGSDHFRALLSVILHLVPVRDPDPLQKPLSHHFIIGSRSETSIRSMARLEELGYMIFQLPASAIRDDQAYAEWTTLIGYKVKGGEKVVVSGPSGTVAEPVDAGNIAGKVALAAKVVAGHSERGTRLFIEGGETASSFFREMGWDQVDLCHFHDVGVVTLQPEGAGLSVTVKPGSYPWPETLLE